MNEDAAMECGHKKHRVRQLSICIDCADQAGRERLDFEGRLLKAASEWDYFKWMLEKIYGGPTPYLDRAIKAVDDALTPPPQKERYEDR